MGNNQVKHKQNKFIKQLDHQILNVKPTKYELFCIEAIEYFKTYSLFQTINPRNSKNIIKKFQYSYLLNIIDLYCGPTANLLFDFTKTNTSLQFNNKSKIIAITKYPVSFLKASSTNSDKKNNFYSRNIIISEEQKDTIWVIIDDHVVCYSPKSIDIVEEMNYVSTSFVKMSNINQDILTLRNIQSLHIDLNRSYVIIANNGYKHDNVMIGVHNNMKYCHWSGFMVIHRAQDEGRVRQYHYITTELISIMGHLVIGSFTEVAVGGQSKSNKLYMKLFQNNTTANIFTEIECIHVLSGYISDCLESIHKIFNMNNDILLCYDNQHWILYVPIDIYNQNDKEYIVFNNTNTDNDACIEVIDINDNVLKYFYRKNNDYVLFHGKHNEINKELQLSSFNPNLEYFFGQFQSVLNDYRNNRFLVTNNAKMFFIQHDDS